MAESYRTNGHQASLALHLVPKSVREALTSLFKGLREWYDEETLAVYEEALDGCSMEEVWTACKAWLREPHEKAPTSGQLLHAILERRKPRATLEPWEIAEPPRRMTPDDWQQLIADLSPSGRIFLAGCFEPGHPVREYVRAYQAIPHDAEEEG